MIPASGGVWIAVDKGAVPSLSLVGGKPRQKLMLFAARTRKGFTSYGWGLGTIELEFPLSASVERAWSALVDEIDQWWLPDFREFGADGTVRLAAKVLTRLTARFDFADFPLDRQTLAIWARLRRATYA